MRANHESMVYQLIEAQPDLSPEEEARVRQRLANRDRFMKKFGARLSAEVDFSAILEEVYVPLYQEYFTEQELREILAFQKSATGRKAAAVMPQIMQRGMADSLPRIQPALMRIAAEVMAEEQALAAIVRERDEALMLKRKMEEDARRIAEEEERLR